MKKRRRSLLPWFLYHVHLHVGAQKSSILIDVIAEASRIRNSQFSGTEEGKCDDVIMPRQEAL